MSDLYVANPTRQNVTFMFRLPESTKVISQPIPMGGQIKVASGPAGLSTADITAITDHHAIFGMRPAVEIGKVKGLIPLIYSVDKFVTASQLRAALLHNDAALTAEGKSMQRNAAIAITADVEKQLTENQSPSRLGKMDVSIVEEEPAKGYSPDHDPIGVGFMFDRRTSVDDGSGRKQRGRRRAS